MKKVLLTATVQSHIAQFHKPLINMLKENGYEVHVAAKDNLAEKNGLKLDEPDKIFNIPFDRSPLSRNNIVAYQEIKKLLSENNYDIVHCNTPMGGVVTRLAANKNRKNGTKVFYTAHGFHFYKGAPLKNWLIYYPFEKWLATITDKLITITKEDYELAKRKFKTDVFYTHGVGVNSNKYYQFNDYEVKRLKKELCLDNNQFIMLCTGELNANKNQSLLIHIISELIANVPDVMLLLAGNGPLEQQLRELSIEKGVANNVIFLGYKTDLEKYVNIADIVISVSHREGLPLNILEAMLCKKIVVASKNRGHNELIVDGQTGYLVNNNNIDKYIERIHQIYKDESKNKEIINKAYKNTKLYSFDNVLKEMKEIYEIAAN